MQADALAPWIAETTAARVADWKARQEAKAAARAERKAARDVGLKARHARKLARNQPQLSII